MKVVSFFSGLGGLDKGFVDTGYDIIWANDFDKYAVQTYKANFGEHIVLGDINEIPLEEIPHHFERILKSIDNVVLLPIRLFRSSLILFGTSSQASSNSLEKASTKAISVEKSAELSI